VVSLIGDLVLAQMNRYGVSMDNLKKIYRKAKPNDIEKWFQAIEKEKDTMRIARQIVADLNLSMKISDVEFQGDKTKATFYYISDERVDFRQLIKEYAEQFRVRIEMKQIGARQEAGKVGGIGTCGRELCCSQWMSSFVSVSTSAARYQEVSLNPQKLAGQCGKLKCCLNYELKCYLDAQSDFPDTSIPLETEQGKAYHNKTDVFRRIIWYTFEKNTENAGLIPLDVDVVKDIIAQNRQGIKVKELHANEDVQSKKSENNYQNAAGEDSISRFEEKKRKKKKNKGSKNKNNQPEPIEKKQTVGVVSGEQKTSQNNKNRHKNRNNRNRNDNRDKKRQDNSQQTNEG
jgi:cell fate regulator YaaT (PSP1 superfamily)